MTKISDDLYVHAFLRFVTHENPKSGDFIPWLKDRTIPKKLVEAILSVPLFEGIKVGRDGDDDFAPITPQKAVALVAKGREVFVEFKNEDVTDSDLFINLHLDDGLSRITLIAQKAELMRHQATALDDMITALQGCWKAMKDVAGLDGGRIQFQFMRRPLDCMRCRPPRQSNRYPDPSMVTFLDAAFHASGAVYTHPGDVQALTIPPPPSPAETTEEDGLVTVRWARSLSDDDLIAGAGGHNVWITERIETDPVPGFNEVGDVCWSAGKIVPKPPLTLYNAETKIGYKAVLILPDGSAEESAWKEAKDILRAKALPDGTPVDHVCIVVPLREHVFQIADRAKQEGFEAVLYMGEKGEFWNVNPSGLWRGEIKK
jgi:hypothetical protein